MNNSFVLILRSAASYVFLLTSTVLLTITSVLSCLWDDPIRSRDTCTCILLHDVGRTMFANMKVRPQVDLKFLLATLP